MSDDDPLEVLGVDNVLFDDAGTMHHVGVATPLTVLRYPEKLVLAVVPEAV